MNKIWWKQLHNVLGLSSAAFLLMLLATGVLLNHPGIIGGTKIRAFAADPRNPEKLFQGREDGIFVSENGGAAWEEVPMLYPPENVADIKFSPDGQDLYAVEKWGRILASHDGGRVWSAVKIPFDPQSEGVELEGLSVSKGGNLVLLTSHGWLKSSDGGKLWDETHFNKKARPLHRLILTIHNGYFFGPNFVWVYDFSAAALFILIISGVVLWKIGRSVS